MNKHSTVQMKFMPRLQAIVVVTLSSHTFNLTLLPCDDTGRGKWMFRSVRARPTSLCASVARGPGLPGTLNSRISECTRRWFSTESASHRRLRVCSAAALRGALLAHAAWCATRTRLWLVSCYSPIAHEQLVTMKRSPCVLCSSLFGNSLYAGLTLRARATRGLRRPTSGYRPYVGRLYGPRR